MVVEDNEIHWYNLNTLRVGENRNSDNIIILAMGRSRLDCPYDAEVYAVNTGYRQIAHAKGRADKIFVCHRGQEYDHHGDPIFDWDELNYLASKGVEIVSLFDVKELKKFTRLNFTDLTEKFETNYFSDSIAYMLAYALHLNTYRDEETNLLKLTRPLKIRLYGVDMYSKDEYATERGGIEYYVAVARTLGVDLWIHPDSAVCKTDSGQPYGFRKINYKKLDEHNIMELQKTPEGVKKMLVMGLISTKECDKMLEYFEQKEREKCESTSEKPPETTSNS